jgi:hypothetical protein
MILDRHRWRLEHKHFGIADSFALEDTLGVRHDGVLMGRTLRAPSDVLC